MKPAWPERAHVALWIIPNIELFSLMEKMPATGAAIARHFVAQAGKP